MRCASRYLFAFLMLLTTGYLRAQQKEANVWYFGRLLGLDFNSGVAVPLNDGQLSTTEGVASICDKNGGLLFYTEGTKIWNRFHQVMPNGTGLFGSFTSSQSAIIVPKIGDTTRYYVFTVDAESGPRGLTYSVVNMTLDNGKGDIELKNVSLLNNVVEKITAVRHCNNRDVWVVGHKSVSDTYFAFLVNPSGINATPVLSNTGSVLWGVIPPGTQDSTSLGYLKASPNGKRIAAAHWTVNVDVSDFDNATGVVSNSYSLFQPSDPHYLSYGIEFSPNSQLVYTTVFFRDPITSINRNALFQYDVSLGSAAAVRASKQVIIQNSDPIQTFAALQIAPDGKMYMAKNTYSHIAAINSPNVYGAGCGFVSNAIQFNLPGQQSSFGLPSFIQTYFYPVDSFSYNISCPGSTATFNYTPSSGTNSVLWNFGDPSSGANNTSTSNNPVHTFSATGSYNIQLIKFTNCGPDTLRKTIQTHRLDTNLGADTLICGGMSVLLNGSASGSNNSFLWQDGSTNPTFLATTSGLYWVEERNNMGCMKRDSINVNFKPSPIFNLGADTFLCATNAITLNAASANADNYLWNTGAVSSSLQVNQAGVYWCEARKSGCIFNDTISIAARPDPIVNLGADTTVCEDVQLTLDATYLSSIYLWQNGSTNASQLVTQPGTYFVQVNYNGCKKSDTIRINYTLKPKFTLGPDLLICSGKSIQLQPTLDPSWQLTWQDGSSSPVYIVTQPGTYSLTAANSCGSNVDEVIVSKGACKVSIPTAFTPNRDGKNDLFRILGTETVTVFNLKIFNRWGQMVFETSEKNKGWDGKLNGQDADPGTFVFFLTYTDSNVPEPQSVKGTLVLIR